MTFEPDVANACGVNIKVIGVGGGGNNAVNRMIASNIRDVQFVAVNTDRQVLTQSESATPIIIGEKITKGWGAGANPEVGARAAEESIDEIKAVLANADMVFVTAGMGGGTGTGAAPVVARAAQEMGILTIGIVTKPFSFEGARRMNQAESGIAELTQYVDSLVVIPNERLKQVSETRITLKNAFEIADDVLRRGVQSISELINVPGFINLDFADVTSVMRDAGYAHMGTGSATGKDKAEIAAKAAISSPLLETSIKGATGILVSITMSPDVGLEDADLASSMITAEAHPDANVIWGAAFDPDLEDEMKITIIATGFENPGHNEHNRNNPTPATANARPQNANQPQRNNAPQQKQAAAPAVAPTPAPAAQAEPAPATNPTPAPAPQPAPQPAPAPAPAPTNTPKAPQGGDSFDDIMSILRSRKPRNDYGSGNGRR